MAYPRTLGEHKAFIKEYHNADDETPIIWRVKPRPLFRTKEKKECNMSYEYCTLNDTSKYGIAFGKMHLAFIIGLQKDKILPLPEYDMLINQWANTMAHYNYTLLSELLFEWEKNLKKKINEIKHDIKYTEIYKKQEIANEERKFYNNEEYKFMKSLVDIQQTPEYRNRLEHFKGREYSVIYITI